eukprot:TRINITY_DN22403_c0_g1_i1.p1 TRINITY_DN22403_c0_g1~~TRINITY_DN22403_c0_g1_i1.p1  ORF type:complete len:1182 (+),score=218.16 TRINITY_DN22403_c0_g1_i1:121-3666(+)
MTVESSEEVLDHGSSARRGSLLLHGYTAGPALLEFVSRLVSPLRASPRIALTDLAAKAGAQMAPMVLALRTCSALGFVDLDLLNGSCSLRSSQHLEDLCQCLGQSSATALQLRRCYAESPPLQGEALQLCLGTWAAGEQSWRNVQSQVLSALIDGIVLVPIFASIACLARPLEDIKSDMYDDVDLSAIADSSRDILDDILNDLGFGSLDAKGSLRLSPEGRQAMDAAQRCLSEGGPALLAHTTDLAQNPLPRLSSSVLAYPGLLEDLMFQVQDYFSGDDYESQPRFVVDAACGDGSLLVSIYELVKNLPRGKVLKEFPLTMIGIGADETSLVSPKMKLCRSHIPHKVFTGRISNPAAVISSLKQRKIDPSKSLHVRVCADQSRCCVSRDVQLKEGSAAVMFAKSVLQDVVHWDEQGQLLTPEQIFGDLVAYFAAWADAVDGSFGLCFSEEMLLDVPTTRQVWSDDGCAHRDFLRALCGRYLVPSSAFAMAAAMAGLFPVDVKKTQPYPAKGSYCHTLSQALTRRYYKIRFASPEDLSTLEMLEEMAYEKHMRTPKEGLLKRLQASPTTVLVAEAERRVVCVLYMQRINKLEDVRGQQIHKVFEAHVPHGKILQLISINAHRDYKGIGNELRSFALHLARLDSSIDSVCAVTLCHDYAGSGAHSLQEYVDSHVAGRVNDRILTFHTSYGASILELVPGFRPMDVDNETTGVLIQYRPKEEWVARSAEMPEETSTAMVSAPERKMKDKSAKKDAEVLVPTLEILSSIMSELGYELDMENLSQGFFSSGLDSFDMGVIQNRLSRALGRQLPATLMLDLPSAKDLCDQLDLDRGVKKTVVTIADSEDAIEGLKNSAHVDEDDTGKASKDRSASRSRTAIEETGTSDDAILSWVKNWRKYLYKVERQRRAASPGASHRRRSTSRRRSKGAASRWENMTADGLEQIQQKLMWTLKLPHNQRRLQRVVEKSHDNHVSFMNDLRPVLDSITGPVMLAMGLLPDCKPTSMQDARDDMDSCAARLGPEAIVQQRSLLALMKIDRDLPGPVQVDASPPPGSSNFQSFVRRYRNQSRNSREARPPRSSSWSSDEKEELFSTGGNGRGRTGTIGRPSVPAVGTGDSKGLSWLMQQIGDADKQSNRVNSIAGSDSAEAEEEDAEEQQLMEALSKLKGPLRQKLAKAALLLEKEGV